MKRFALALILVAGFSAAPLQADLAFIDPEVVRNQLAGVNDMYSWQDVAGLLAALRDSHLIVQREVAIKLGRLGAKAALDDLRKLDAQYADFACLPSGEFGVAVMLIENPDKQRRRAILLDVATGAVGQSAYSFSVIDKAGRELSEYDGDDIAGRLANVNNYGAQYTVLSQGCRKLSKNEAIAFCIDVLSQHETPQKAEAAGEMLVSFGQFAVSPVRELRDKAAAKSGDPGHPINHRGTVISRCDRILWEIAR